MLLDTWTELSKYSTAQLVRMTHEAGSPWDMIWNHSKQREITKEQIEKYFTRLKLTGMDDKLRLIPTVEPMFREDGVPVFSYREVTN